MKLRHMILDRRVMIGGLAALAAPGCAKAASAEPMTKGQRLATAARKQIGVTTEYDPAYRRLAYPGGDVPRKTGVCADVVVRAARDALGLDLQKLMHEDMRRAFDAYPKRWGLKKPDANIDHRRVSNLETYWRRQDAEVWRGRARGDRFPRSLWVGDILTWDCLLGGPHVGIVASTGWNPKIVHNMGGGTEISWLITFLPHAAVGHYRWPK
jgi:uncharacterized protein YijF (DUF1287 family)